MRQPSARASCAAQRTTVQVVGGRDLQAAREKAVLVECGVAAVAATRQVGMQAGGSKSMCSRNAVATAAAA